jgi:vacuolar-type H+-ATPase subunit H
VEKMAKDTIDAIREAESAAEANEKEARKKAGETVQNAQAEAEKYLSETAEKAKAAAEEAEKTRKAAEETMLQRKQKETEAEITLLKQKAKVRMPEAVSAIVKALTE